MLHPNNVLIRTMSSVQTMLEYKSPLHMSCHRHVVKCLTGVTPLRQQTELLPDRGQRPAWWPCKDTYSPEPTLQKTGDINTTGLIIQAYPQGTHCSGVSLSEGEVGFGTVTLNKILYSDRNLSGS